MKLLTIGKNNLTKVKPLISSFITKYGDKRITHRSIRWIKSLDIEDLTPDNLITLAHEKNKVAGVIVFGGYGLTHSLISVRPEFRKEGIGKMLVKDAIDKLPKIYSRVATDNLASLSLCFSCGFVAFKMFKGPTNKPTLWLATGDWNEEEVEEYSKLF